MSQGMIWGVTYTPNSSCLWRNCISKSHAGVHQNNLKRSPLPNSFPSFNLAGLALSPLSSLLPPHTHFKPPPRPTLSASPLDVFQPSGMSESKTVSPQDSLPACLSPPGWTTDALPTVIWHPPSSPGLGGLLHPKVSARRPGGEGSKGYLCSV